MRKKKEGDTLGVKIQNHLEKMKKNDVTQIIGDAFYEQVFEQGIPFYERRTNLLRDMKVTKGKEADAAVININKTINIPDDVQLRKLAMEAEAEKEAKRDRTFDEFFEMYGEHLAGKVDPQTRVGGRPETAPWDNGLAKSQNNQTGQSNAVDGEDDN